MGITGLIPFLDKASRRANVSEFSGCTVAVDTYCWLHKGAFGCAEKLVRGEETDIHIRYCLKYVTMLLSKNIKPILVFDGCHLPAKALTESKRRESRAVAKKRAAELLTLGKFDEARTYMRRSVDITHGMALGLMKECRKRNVDCIVAPYEADAQLAYLNIKNIAHLVITEDSDLILFGCTKVLFKMDLEGMGTLVETVKLPLVMKCPIEHYTFDKFRQMCIMSGCDYLPSLPGIGLAKARQFIVATQQPNIATALKHLPNYFSRMSLTVSDEYRENFLKAEATFKHQYVFDPIEREMVRLTDVDDDDVEEALCGNAGQPMDSETALQLAFGNIDPFTKKRVDHWHPDHAQSWNTNVKTSSWNEKGVSNHPSIWSEQFKQYLNEHRPWAKKERKLEPIVRTQTRPRDKVVNLVSKYIPETEDQNLTIENLSNMYCVQSPNKRQKMDVDEQVSQTFTETQTEHNKALIDETVDLTSPQKSTSPVLVNKERCYKKRLVNGKLPFLQKLSQFPRTVLDEEVVESKFFNGVNKNAIEESLEKKSRNPFKVNSSERVNIECSVSVDTQFTGSQKENCNNGTKQTSPILVPSPRIKCMRKLLDEPFSTFEQLSDDSMIDNTYPLEGLVTPTDSQLSFGTVSKLSQCDSGTLSQPLFSQKTKPEVKRSCKVPGLKKAATLPSNQPTLLSKFGFQKRSAMKWSSSAENNT